MHVGPFKAVQSKKILEEIEKTHTKDANVFKCNYNKLSTSAIDGGEGLDWVKSVGS